MTSIEELSNQLIPLLFTVAVGWYISHFARATIPRLLFFIFGAYFAILGRTEFDNLIGLGLTLPHIKFFFSWIIETLDGLRKGTLDIYYTFLTIFYKTRNVFVKAYRFFSGKKHRKQKKSTGNDYYEKQENRQYEDFGQSSQSQSRSRREERQEQQEEDYSYQDNHSNYEEPKQKPEDDIASEYKQFFTNDDYIILGISRNDDCDTIKKKWRKLQREYHPDLNMDMFELCNEITSRINGAYMTIKKQKAC